MSDVKNLSKEIAAEKKTITKATAKVTKLEAKLAKANAKAEKAAAKAEGEAAAIPNGDGATAAPADKPKRSRAKKADADKAGA
jgi:hypothetical protein